MDNRKTIEETVSRNPGIGFSELKKKTGLANGVLQHHIRNSKQVVKRKGALLERGACRDCVFKEYCGEKCTYHLLRNRRSRDVLELKAGGLRNIDIAEELGVDPSTVTYHVQKLEEAQLL